MALPLRSGFRYGMTLTRRSPPVRETSDQLRERFGHLSSAPRRKSRRLFPLSLEAIRYLKAEKSRSRRRRIKEAKDKMDALGTYARRPSDVPYELWRYVQAHWNSPKARRRTGVVRKVVSKKKVRKTTHPRAI